MSVLLQYMNNMTLSDVFFWMGSFCVVAGQILLCLKFRFSKYGFVIHLVAGAFLISAAIMTSQEHILFLNIFMTIVNLIGLYQWFFGHKVV